MSKSSTASSSKLPPLPTKSAWSRGPPATASLSSPRTATPPSSSTPQRTSSPAPSTPISAAPSSAGHSRRPSSALNQAVSIKDGVTVPRANVGASKQAPAVTFGSIDDASAPISQSPASVPPIAQPGGVKTFGSVPVQSQTNGNGTTPATTSTSASIAAPASSPSPAPTHTKINKADIAKLFQSKPTTSPSPSSAPGSSPADAGRSPAVAPVPLSQPSTSAPGSGPPSGLPAFTPFVPSAGFRPPQPPQNGPNGGPGPGPGPRSPAYQRPMANGARPPPGPNAPPTPSSMNTALPSPRISTPHQHPAPTPGLPPQQPPHPGQYPVPGWPGYYYPAYQMPGMPPPGTEYMPYPGWGMPPAMQQHPHQSHLQPQPPPGQPGGPPHGGMPISPRNPQQHLPPGTPTQVHALPTPSPSSTGTPSLPPVASPSTPSPGTPSQAHQGKLNSNASAFVPGGPRSKIVIKSADGRDVDINDLRKGQSPVTPSMPTLGHGTRETRKSIIRMESEQAKKEREDRERAEKERKLKEEEDRKEKGRQAEAKKMEEERLRKEEEERKVREEEQRKKDEEERVRREKEEEARRVKEEEERVKREDEERKAREEAEEQERVRKEQEEKERLRKEEEETERLRLEAEEAAAKSKAEAEATANQKAKEEAQAIEAEKEDGEIDDLPSEKPAVESKDKDKDPKAALRINTILEGRRRPGPLDLSSAQKGPIPQPLPSALATARIIDDLGQISYPEGIKSPKVELNINAKDGKFRYDREFLLQFMSICTEKPDMLPPLDAIGLEPADQSYMTRNPRRSSSAMAPQMSRQPSVGLGISGNSGFKQGGSGFTMGQFATPTSKLSSDERFAMAQQGRNVSGPAGFAKPPMTRTSSQPGSGRIRSKKGHARPPIAGPAAASPIQIGPNGQPLEPVAPLEASKNAWKAASTSRRPAAVNPDSPEVVDRKVKSLLNKLTMEKFDTISDQIITWANKSEKETDGRTLIQVIRLVFEKATDEAAWSEMYARLCRKMMEQISSAIQDETIELQPGQKAPAGGQLFRKYLLNRCQEDFERGWAAKDATAAAAAEKAGEDAAAKADADKSAESGKEGDGEAALYSEEYYASQKAKRQGLGLVKFIGELFKLQMLTERIMHECVKKLLSNLDNPEEEEIESLCKLMTTVGQQLDTARAKPHMDIYFSRMKELLKNPKVNSRMQFMLQDVIELRERKWLPRNAVAAPTTIAQLRENAAHEKAAQDKDAYHRTLSMSRGGSRRGGDRNDVPQVGPDGWTAVQGAGNAPRPPPKAGDLSQFGKISKGATPVGQFGPGGIFASKDKSKRDSLSRSSSNANMFAMLGSSSPDMAAEVAAASSKRGPSRKGSADFTQTGLPEPATRRKLQLLPRTKPVESTTPAPSAPPSDEEDEGEADAPSMSEEDAKKKVAEDSKEFFSIRNLDEAEEYFSALPSSHHHMLVDKLVMTAIESKATDAELVGALFARASEKELCSPDMLEQGFMPTAELLDDIAIDAPKAFDLMAAMLKGAALDSERCQNLASKSMDSDKLLALLS